MSKTLAKDDYDTRFDLGIAYREMELFADAQSEFAICIGSETWRLESLHMMALCAMDLGNFENATNHLEQALATPGLSHQKEAGLRFDLARGFEAQGDFARARDAFMAAKVADPSIPGIDECATRVAAQISAEQIELQDEAVSSAEEGELESFGDQVAEAKQHEAFESFDDVVAEAEAEAEAEGKAEAEAESLDGTDVDKPPKRRRKKISFV